MFACGQCADRIAEAIITQREALGIVCYGEQWNGISIDAQLVGYRSMLAAWPWTDSSPVRTQEPVRTFEGWSLG